METISVVFEPLGSQFGRVYYHQTLLYTNSSGQQYYATSGPASAPAPGLVTLSQAALSAQSKGSSGESPYGVLYGQSGPVSQLSSATRNALFSTLGPPNYSEVVSSGSDLSAQWSAITNAYSQINTSNLQYSPLTQNSNSAASTGLTAAGISLPTDTGLLGSHWAPASNNILQTTLTNSSSGTTTTLGSNGGNISGSISDNGSGNGNPFGISLSTNSNQTQASGTISNSSGLDTTEAYTQSANGSSADTVNNYVSGKVEFSQSVSVNSNGQETVSISGTGYSGLFSNSSITISNNTTANLSGASNSISLGSGSNITIFGSNNTTSSSSDTLNIVGNNANENIGGQSNTVNANGNNQELFLTSSKDTAYTNASSTGEYFGANSASEIAIGKSGIVSGSGDHASMVNYSNSMVVFEDGQNDSVQAKGNQSVLQDSGTSLSSVIGGTSVNMDASNQAVTANAGNVVFVADNETGERISAFDSKIYEGSNDTVDVVGSGDHVYGTSTDDNTGDPLSGSDDGGDGGYGYGGYGYGGYDFTSTAASLTSKGVDLGHIAQFDKSIGASGAERVATDSLAQAQLASVSTDLAGAATTAVMSGAQWEVATDAEGSKVVTWSFADSAAGASDPFSSYIGDQYKGEIEKALQDWSNATGITFKEVSDSPTADLRFGFGDFETSSTGILGYTSAATEGGGAFAPGVVIRLEDPTETALDGIGRDGATTYAGTDATLYQVAAHEIGRALGFADNADPNSVMFASSSASNRTLDATDIAGGQLLYGTTAVASDAASAVSSMLASRAEALTGASADTLSSTNQLVQAMATFSPVNSTVALTPTIAQNAALAQQLSAPLHQAATH